MVEIFDLISLFAFGSFFAWLGYAPLQAQKLKEESDPEKAKDNLSTITDYFLISFLFFSVAAIADYLFHHPAAVIGQALIQPFVSLTAEIAFVYGFLTLIVPMLYLRTIGRTKKGRPEAKRKGFADLNPSPFGNTVFATVFGAVNWITWWAQLSYIEPAWVSLRFVISGIISTIGVIRTIRDWRPAGAKALLNLLALFSPVLLTFVLRTILHI